LGKNAEDGRTCQIWQVFTKIEPLQAQFCGIITAYYSFFVKVAGRKTCQIWQVLPSVADEGLAVVSIHMDKKTTAKTIRDLYPNLTDEQLAEVEDTWERYLALVLRIFERQELEKAAQLTEDADTLPCEALASNSS
jgi:hypothetical protein